jgi:hypothetical protein
MEKYPELDAVVPTESGNLVEPKWAPQEDTENPLLVLAELRRELDRERCREVGGLVFVQGWVTPIPL